ncbi:MAG: ThuA domain-containing protein [Spirochaetaceae bacterium]
MNIIVLSDDKWHPKSVVKDGLTHLVKVHNVAWATDLKGINLSDFSLIILAKINHVSSVIDKPWMTNEIETQFCDFVENGGTLFVIHAGTAGYNNCNSFRNIIGGVFDHHPEQCLVTYKHKNKEPYTVKDEHYFMTLDQQDLDIFMTSESEHGIQPAGWTKDYGSGKIIVFTPGHNLDVWLNKINREIIEEVINAL